jgi:hypothetical protein
MHWSNITAGQDVMVVAHSYGATVPLCACDGLWKGKGNGVVKVHILSGSLLLPGQSIAGFRMAGAAKHPEKAFDESGVPKEQIGDVCIHHLPVLMEI